MNERLQAIYKKLQAVEFFKMHPKQNPSFSQRIFSPGQEMKAARSETPISLEQRLQANHKINKLHSTVLKLDTAPFDTFPEGKDFPKEVRDNVIWIKQDCLSIFMTKDSACAVPEGSILSVDNSKLLISYEEINEPFIELCLGWNNDYQLFIDFGDNDIDYCYYSDSQEISRPIQLMTIDEYGAFSYVMDLCEEKIKN